MAKVERIEKWMDSGESDNQLTTGKRKTAVPAKSALTPRRTGKKSGKFELLTSTQDVQLLLKEAPDHPDFLGKIKMKIEEPKKKGLFKRKQYPELNKLRAELNSLTTEGKVATYSRQKVRADIRAYPDVPDLHVINAVYTYQDIPRIEKVSDVSTIAHNKMLENQQIQLKSAIHEIVLAFSRGGLSIFNVNWFMKIYIDYLNVYKSRLTYAYSNFSSRKDKESQSLVSKIAIKRAQINELLEIKERFGGINRISRRMNGTSYLADAFTPLEIRKATIAVKGGDPNRVIADGKRAGKMIAVLMVMLFLLAKVPILKYMVEEVLNMIPEDDRSILLRKRMIATIYRMTQFQLALISKDIQKARQSANDLYGYCLETINRYLQSTYLKEQYEIDAYLKAIWLVKSADHLFSRTNYKEMITQSYKFIKLIQSDKNHLEEKNREVVIDLANKYTYQLDTILDQHGWMGEFESMEWQNRD